VLGPGLPVLGPVAAGAGAAAAELLPAPELPLLVPGRRLAPEQQPQALIPMQKELGPPPLELLVAEQPLVEESQEPVQESQQKVSLRQVAH
jgi:hypothetical protein